MSFGFENWVAAATIAVVCALSHGTTALAHGAVAIGSTGNVVKDGIAYGGSNNFATRKEAEEGALSACRKFNAPKAAKRCAIATTFKGECYAIANDPKAGTPGTGWAVAGDQDIADERALAACRASAGADRQKYCVVDQQGCDGQ